MEDSGLGQITASSSSLILLFLVPRIEYCIGANELYTQIADCFTYFGATKFQIFRYGEIRPVRLTPNSKIRRSNESEIRPA
jgi:hypothetical protein